MSKVVPINRNNFQSLDAIMAYCQETWPNAKKGIVIVFDPDNDMAMHTHYCASSSLLAYAGVNLARLAMED